MRIFVGFGCVGLCILFLICGLVVLLVGFDWFLVCVIGWWLGCRFVGVSLGFGMLAGGLRLVVFVILRLVLVVTCGGVVYLLWLT